MSRPPVIIFAEARLWLCTSTSTNRGEKHKRNKRERKERQREKRKELQIQSGRKAGRGGREQRKSELSDYELLAK